MRRKDREITDFHEMLEVIRKCDVCRLALHDEDFPYMVPLNFGMDVRDGQVSLYFHSALQGKKLDLIKKDNRASFEMDCDHQLLLLEEDMNCTMTYQSIIGCGTMEILPEEEKYEALKILMRQYHAEDFPFKKETMKATAVLKLTVSQMTGKRRTKTPKQLSRQS